MPNTTVDHQLLRFLITLYKTQSLTTTVTKMAMSLSSGSRYLQHAREVFRDRLFMRSGQKMFPTTEMRRLYPDMEAALDALDKLVGPRFFNPGASRRVYRIASLDCAFTLILEPAINKAKEVAPDLRFEIYPFQTNSFEDLRQGMLDLLIFGYSAPIQENMHKRELGRAPYSLLMRRDHPLLAAAEAPGGLTREDVERYELVAITSAFSSEHQQVRLPWFGDELMNSGLQIPYFLSAAFSVLDSDRIVLVPEPLAQLIESRMPDTRSCSFARCTNRYWNRTLFWHERTNAEPEMQWFRGVIENSVHFSTPEKGNPA